MSTIALRFARFYAATKHVHQQYSGGLPYTHHLAAVEQVLRRFGYDYDEELLCAAWLHDVVEDTDTKIKEITELFGEGIASLVDAVTNEAPEQPRKVRSALTYPKIRKAGYRATRLKLADRIANVEQGGNLVKMYAREHEEFKHGLFVPLQNEDLWNHLDALLAKSE